MRDFPSEEPPLQTDAAVEQNQPTIFGMPDDISEWLKKVFGGIKGLVTSGASEDTNNLGRNNLSFTPSSNISFAPPAYTPPPPTVARSENGICVSPEIVALFSSNPEAAQKVEDIRINFLESTKGLPFVFADVKVEETLSRVSPTAGLPNMAINKAQSVGGFSLSS